MCEDQHLSDTIFSSSPLRKIVHFNQTTLMPSQSTTPTSFLTSSSSTSLTFPLLVEKPGVRFKLLFLLLSLLIALIIGFILSLILVTQFIHIPTRTSYTIQNNYLFEHFDSIWIEQLDFNANICEDFYNFCLSKMVN